jgi:hypothetical protein
MTPIYCQECGRANGVSARRCIWCGSPIVEGGNPISFDPTQIEIEYLDGIERLDDPTPVRLRIDANGVEVTELMPGSRTIRLPAESLIRADVVDASVVVEPTRERRPLWKMLLLPFTFASGGEGEIVEMTQYDYVLTIRYKNGDGTRNAVFHRQDRAGLSIVEGLARIINMLARLKSNSSSAG